MSAARYAVGIDGGGTKTVAAVLDTSFGSAKPVIGRAGACNIAAMPIDDALANVQAAVSAAHAQPESIAGIVAAVAGYSFADRREELSKALHKVFPLAIIQVVPDYVAAFAGALAGGPGVVVIAGTGSVAYGENKAGESHRAGGYGYLIDDAGSGYWVGRSAIAAVLRAADGTGPKTTLSDRLAAELGSAAWNELIPGIYGGAIDRVRIASLSRTVSSAAKEDADEVSLSILIHAGGALAGMVEAVASRLFTSEQPFDLCTVGGMWQAGPALTDVFQRSVDRFAPNARRTEPREEPAVGAALRAALLAPAPSYKR